MLGPARVALRRRERPPPSPGDRAAARNREVTMSRFRIHTPFWRAAFAPLALSVLVLLLASCATKHTLAPQLTSTELASSAARGGADPLCGRPSAGIAIHREGRSESGALWALDKPARWNGDLVVYLHGYTDPSLPVALPNYFEIRDSLLARGFAVAASSYSANGYAVPEGLRDSHALNELFAERVARPRRTFLLGQSLGGLIGMLLTQKYSWQYDGSMLVAGVVGGTDEELQYMGDIRVLFDTVYPGVLAGDLEHPPVITDLNTQVVGPVLQAVNANPQGVGIIQLLARRPLPGNNGNEIVASLINVLGFAMQGGGDIFQRTHQHHFFDNAGWRYTSPALPAALLDDINARVARYAIAPDAAAYLERYGEPSGPFRIPVLTLHHSRDPVVPVFHEDLLAQVAAGPNLEQRRFDAYGHTTFTAGELMTNFADLVGRAHARDHDLAFSTH
jgi:alpha-beta hydrolase superfamily lysophospholipase